MHSDSENFAVKKLTTPAGVYGPFNAVTTTADHYEADGTIMPFSVYGAGGVVSDAVPGELFPPVQGQAVVPQFVTMRQARLALLGAGLLDDVDAAITAITDPVQRRAAQIEWEYAQTVDRASAFMQQLAAGLGLTDTQLDDLFTQAAAL